MEKRIDKLEEKVDLITDNHLVHIKDSISILNSKVEKWITNTEWLVKFFWIATTSAIGSLIAGIMGLIMK